MVQTTLVLAALWSAVSENETLAFLILTSNVKARLVLSERHDCDEWQSDNTEYPMPVLKGSVLSAKYTPHSPVSCVQGGFSVQSPL